MIQDVKQAVRNHWRGILRVLGMDESFLTNRHGPCPICGGKDRWRFDDKGGTGSFICNNCGSGDGWKLLLLWRGWDFKTAVSEVRPIVGATEASPMKQEQSPAQKLAYVKETWKAARPVAAGDPVDRYLTARGLGLDVYPKELRFHPNCRVSADLSLPAMLALVQDTTGKAVNLQRTWLGDGCKADISEPRRIMPGDIPKGSAVRLGPVARVLGVAEGVETALAAARLFQHPVWAVLSTSLMMSWLPPEGVEEVVIYADHDRNHAGHAAAYALSKSLRMKGIPTSVKHPPEEGMDWADMALCASTHGSRAGQETRTAAPPPAQDQPDGESQMPFPVSENSGQDFALIPAGLHVGRCVRVIDLGLQPSNFGDKHIAMIGWEIGIPVDGRPDQNRIISQRYTPSLAPKATLRQMLESWRGRAFSKEELAGFDLFNTLGKWCQISVIHSAPNARGEIFANVTGVFPLPKGTAKFQPHEEEVGIALDEMRPPNALDLVGNGLKTKITAGLAKLRAQASTQPPAGQQKGGMDDEIPF